MMRFSSLTLLSLLGSARSQDTKGSARAKLRGDSRLLHTVSLEAAILEDMMPPTSGACTPQAADTSYAFESSAATSNWYPPFVQFEEEVFLAKMQHVDANSNRSWTMRFGQAGNIYSFFGPMGETVPPQAHDNAPWIDEVWQQVQPLGPNGNNDGDASTGAYFVHEAGTYQRDSPDTDVPFYSPTLGKNCDNQGGSCGFISWGQQAHVPTPWESPLIYLNRYVNCGDGVIEYTQLRHVNVGTSDVFNYMNTPWGGTRKSVLKDVVATTSANELELIYPLAGWGDADGLRSLGDTAGYTVFAQDLPKPASSQHGEAYPLPAGVSLTLSAECFETGAGTRIICPLVPTTDPGCNPCKGADGLVVLLQGEGGSLPASINHWAWRGNRLYLWKSWEGGNLTAAEVNQVLNSGTKTITPAYYDPYPLPDGVKLALRAPCFDSGARIICPLDPTADPGGSPSQVAGGLVVQLEGNTGSVIASINHWAWGGSKMFMWKSWTGGSLSAAEVNAALWSGSTSSLAKIRPLYYEPDLGMPEEDNLALAHVHGGQDTTGNYPRVRWGSAGATRDYNVYTINPSASITGGDTYHYRQYFIMDKYTNMASRGPTWAGEAGDAKYAAGSKAGRSVSLYSDGTSIFGYTLSGGACTAGSPTLVCEGSTTPQPTAKALFQVHCGSSYAVTQDPYYFTPAGDEIRSYVCDGQPGIRPVWKLLGFFDSTDCAAISTGYQWNEAYC